MGESAGRGGTGQALGAGRASLDGAGAAVAGPARSGRWPPRRAWKAAFFAAAAVAIVAGVAWALLGSRFLVVRSVRVTGTGPGVSAPRVLAAAHVRLGLPLIRVNDAAVARRVERIRQVESARVSTDWPSGVVISVRLRTPVFAVAGARGYQVIDRFGVTMREVRRRPAGLPLLTVRGGPAATSLRNSPAVRAAAAVLRELPARVARQVGAVTAAGPSDMSVRLTGGVVIVWGDSGRAAQKARELTALLRTHARVYDVSAPGAAMTKP